MANEVKQMNVVALLIAIVALLAIVIIAQVGKDPVVTHTWLPVHGVLILEEGHIFKATPYIKLQICAKHEGEIRAVMIPVEDVPWPQGIDYEKFKLFMGGDDEQSGGPEEVFGSEDESSVPNDKAE